MCVPLRGWRLPFSLLAFLALRSENRNYGGQAVIEGVMIRSPKALAVAVRRADGRIVLKQETAPPLTRRHWLLNIPFLRGTFALIDSMVTGMRALTFSADVAAAEENEKLGKPSPRPEGHPTPTDVGEGIGVEAAAQDLTSPTSVAEGPGVRAEPEVVDSPPVNGIPVLYLVGTLLASLAIAVVLFMMLPDWLANLLRAHLPHTSAANVVINLTEGVIRIVFFIVYVLAIGRREVIRRVFQYHGAEHQTIYAFEHDDEVTPENAMRYGTAHPRCGTSFIAVVIFVSILAFSFLNVEEWYIRQALKLALLPVVAGASYEVIRFAGTRGYRFLVLPGLWLQRLTTRLPDRDQVEVAIAALEGVLALEGRTLKRAAQTGGD